MSGKYVEFHIPVPPGRRGTEAPPRRVLVNLDCIAKISDLGDGQTQIDTGHLPFMVTESYEDIRQLLMVHGHGSA